jgi:hypothetical protein
MWPHTTTFRGTLGSLGTPAEFGTLELRILTLRTSKADACVGLRPGKEEIDLCGTRVNEEWQVCSCQLLRREEQSLTHLYKRGRIRGPGTGYELV